MKYENAKDIFPEKLLKQIQKYAAGKLVYIPAMETKRIGARERDTESIFSKETMTFGLNSETE